MAALAFDAQGAFNNVVHEKLLEDCRQAKAHQKGFETVTELTPYRPYSSIRKAEKINPVYKIPDPDFQGTTSNRSDNEVRFSEYGI